ncbi:APC family permease [Micromonospora zhanjiangensis]|uniref:APC family permease n=1 Tax=Micromonospora zhanjiangensis TaxID=1522057 RepID=A0ABV8KWF1_9ACTN
MDSREPAVVTFSPSAELPPLSEQELAVLSQVGQDWSAGLPDWRRAEALPLDPALNQYPTPAPGRFSRIAPVGQFRTETPDRLVADQPEAPVSPEGGTLTRLRRVILGPPLNSAAVVQERIRKLIALPVLSSDLLSSVAYGPEAMLTVLVLAGASALRLTLPISLALVVLMVAVGLSYRQTIRAYPHGAGSYIVAGANLGSRLGLTAGAGLMMDYILTAAVSVASGVDAINSALPRLAPAAVPIGLAVLVMLLAGNLRGVRSAGKLFAAPTYAFVAAVFLLICFGLAQAARRGFTTLPPPRVPATEGLGVLLVLRAFASGATSMTGIEAVSNAVPVFKPVEWRNARTTLTWMVSLLILMFAGLIALIHLDGVAIKPNQTVLSQLAHLAFGEGPLYIFVQATTALILLLAANTAYQDFPRLLFFMARDGYAPRAFLRLGDRLVFSNGIILLTVAAAAILIAFHGRTQALIPLFAVGVFLAFTLSQVGMIRHWLREKGPHWRKNIVINGTGALLSGVVLVTAAFTKFVEGAWVVLAAVPIVILTALRIRRHYDAVQAALSPEPGEQGGEPRQEDGERPGQVLHMAVVPVARLDRAALRALAYAVSLGQPVFAVHVSPDDEEDDRFRHQWTYWGAHLRLEIIVSPHRAIIPTLSHYLQALHALRPDITLTVVLPEVVVKQWWHRPLHHHDARRLRRAVRPLPGIVVTSVPVHVRG